MALMSFVFSFPSFFGDIDRYESDADKKKFPDPQAEYDPAEPSTEDDFDGSPRLPCQDIQITREGDTRQQIREKDINSRCYHELVDYSPVGGISNAKIVPILAKKAKGTKSLRKGHLCTSYVMPLMERCLILLLFIGASMVCIE